MSDAEMNADKAFQEVGYGGVVLMQRQTLEQAALALRDEVKRLRAEVEGHKRNDVASRKEIQRLRADLGDCLRSKS